MSPRGGRGGRFLKRVERWSHVRICRCGHATPITTDGFARMALATHRCGPPVKPAATPAVVLDIDELAVDLVVRGERLPALNRLERREVVRLLTAKGCTAEEIGDRLHITPRSVTRHRLALRRQGVA